MRSPQEARKTEVWAGLIEMQSDMGLTANLSIMRYGCLLPLFRILLGLFARVIFSFMRTSTSIPLLLQNLLYFPMFCPQFPYRHETSTAQRLHVCP